MHKNIDACLHFVVFFILEPTFLYIRWFILCTPTQEYDNRLLPLCHSIFSTKKPHNAIHCALTCHSISKNFLNFPHFFGINFVLVTNNSITADFMVRQTLPIHPKINITSKRPLVAPTNAFVKRRIIYESYRNC